MTFGLKVKNQQDSCSPSCDQMSLKHLTLKLGGVVVIALMLSACAPNDNASDSNYEIPLIVSKTQPVEVMHAKYCDKKDCTAYDLQSVQTNQAWIDSYFLDRIKKTEPNAFSAERGAQVASQPKSSEATSLAAIKQNMQSESMIKVRYLGQNQYLASFLMQSYSYGEGAAHGLTHDEYVNFDLRKRKRIAVDQLLKPNVEPKLLKALYDHNQTWLTQHEIKASELKLSDNYYYGVHGIVFVYPLYELASYAEGMSELTLPYDQAKLFIRAEYVPN